MHQFIATKTDRPKRIKLIFYISSLVFTIALIALLIKINVDSDIEPHLASPFLVEKTLDENRVHGTGKIISLERQFVSAPDDGIIELIAAKEGESISRGQLLLKIKNESLKRAAYDAELEVNKVKSEVALEVTELDVMKHEIQLSLLKAKSELKHQKLELEANLKLKEQGVISELRFNRQGMLVEQATLDVQNFEKRLELLTSSYDNRVAALKTRLEVASDQYAYLKQKLEDLNVYAEIDGVLTQQNLTVGQSIKQGQTVSEIVNNKVLFAEIVVPQLTADRLKVGDDAEITVPGKIITATVDFIDPVVREGARKLRLSLEQDAYDSLSLDQNVNATIKSTLNSFVSTVSAPAAFDKYDSWTVYEIDGDSARRINVGVQPNNLGSLTLSPSVPYGKLVVMIPEELAKKETYIVQ